MKRRSLPFSARVLVSGAFAVLLATAAVPAQAAPEPAPGPSQDQPQPVMPGAQVPPQVTRVLFAQPQTLEEVGTKLAGQQVLRLQYAGDVGGIDQPGPGVPAQQAVDEMRESVQQRYGGEPLIYEVITAGPPAPEMPQRLGQALGELRAFASDSSEIDKVPAGTQQRAAEVTRARSAKLAQGGFDAAKPPPPPANAGPASRTPEAAQPPPTDNPWAPVQGTMAAYANSNENPQGWPNKFRHTLRWDSRQDLNAFGQDFGYEHELTLTNDDISDWPTPPGRPVCNPFDSIYSDFWAAWDSGFKWNAVEAGWTFPAESAPYWDWDDTTDSCQNLNFSIGVGYPTQLEPDHTYSYWIAAKNGEQSSSPYEMGAQKISNDCNNVGMDPGSSCMGLNFTRPGSGTEPLVGASRDWTVPGCAVWAREQDPVRYNNGEAFCPNNQS